LHISPISTPLHGVSTYPCLSNRNCQPAILRSAIHQNFDHIRQPPQCHHLSLGMEIAQGGQGHVGHQNIESQHQQFQQPLLHITRFLQFQKMHKSLVPFDNNLLSCSKLPMDLFFRLALQAQICPVFPPNPPSHLHPILWH
jgi:hypothetical protein